MALKDWKRYVWGEDRITFEKEDNVINIEHTDSDLGSGKNG